MALVALTPRRAVAAASVAAGAALLAVLVAFTPWSLLLERVASVPWPGWVAATLGMSATYALRAGRLRVEWAGTLAALRLGYRECLQVTLLHNAAINLLPMRSGEASYAFLLHRRWGVGLGDAAASLLWLRLQDAMVLGVLGLAILVPAPLPWRLAFATAAIVLAAAVLPAIVRQLHVRARFGRSRARSRRGSPHPGWRFATKIAAAFLAARGGRRAWAYAVSNWVLKLGVVGALLASLAGLPWPRAFAGALGGELAAVLPIQAPAGIGTYEAGVALGARAHRPAAPGAPAAANPASDDNPRLIFGAALAVHALMVVVALATALVFSLIARPPRTPESSS